MRAGVCIRCLLPGLLLLCARVPAQDLMGLFLRGDERALSLGGNPFSISSGSTQLLDLSGSDAARPRLRYTTRVDDVYHEVQSDGNEAGSSGLTRHLEFQLPLSQNALHPVIGVSMTSADFSSGVQLQSQERANFQYGHTSFAMEYTMRLNRLLQIGGTVGQSSNDGQTQWNYTSALIMRPWPGLSLRLQMSDQTSWQTLHLEIGNANGFLPLEFQQRGAHLSVLYASHGLRVNSTAVHSLISSLPNDGSRGAARFHPEGTIDDLSVQTVWSMTEKWHALLAVQWRALRSAGTFDFDGARYGSLGDLRYDDVLVQLGSEVRFTGRWLLLADAEWRRLRGAAAGYADSWPFISIFDSPIASREHFIAHGSAEFWKAHVGTAVPVAGAVTLGFGTNVVHLVPELLLSSWETRVFLFGAHGYQERTLPIRSIDLGILSGGVRAELAGLITEYAFVQFVPIGVLRTADDPGESGGTSPPTPSASSGASNASGGQFHRLSITYEF